MSPPRVVRLFIAVALAQGVWLLALNQGHRVATAGVVIQLLLFWRLYRGSGLCWGLLLLENAFEAIAALAIVLSGFQGGFQGILWGHAAALVIPSSVQIWLLLTRQMRVHIGWARPRVAGTDGTQF